MAADLLVLAVALVTAGLVGFVMIKGGPKLGWVDVPDNPALKAHRRPAVPLGGVGLWLGVNLGMLLAGEADPALAVSSLLLAVVGLIDDRRPLSPILRIAATVVAGGLLGALIKSTWLDALVLAFLSLVAVNAVNLLDGLDGLAGLTGLLAAAGIGIIGVSRGFPTWFPFTVAAALLGFLIWNWHPARLFLGDSGAYVLAIFLVYGIDSASEDLPRLTIAAALLGVFLFDMAATLIRRALTNQPLFSRDRLHLYDRLADRGVPIPHIALASAGLQAAWVGAVVLSDRHLPAPTAIVVLMGLGALIVGGLVRSLGATQPGHWVPQ